MFNTPRTTINYRETTLNQLVGGLPLPSDSYPNHQHQIVVKEISNSFQTYTTQYLKPYLESFYLVGSFVSGGISPDRPDLNYLLIFKKNVLPENYLMIGQITQALETRFAQLTSIRIEFRPFRYIIPHYHHDFEISINPIIISTAEITNMGNVIFNPWFTHALKSNHKLLFGKDYLRSLSPPIPNHQMLKTAAFFDLAFFTLPLSRAPAQYTPHQTHLFLSEALINAKNIAYLGVEVAMTNAELAKHQYLKYIHHKEKLINFYKRRYSPKVAKMISVILDTRQNYLRYRNNSQKAQQIFSISLNLGHIVRQKLYQN